MFPPSTTPRTVLPTALMMIPTAMVKGGKRTSLERREGAENTTDALQLVS